MAKRSGPPPIVFILLFLGLLGGGYFWFFQRKPAQISNPTPTQNNPTSAPTNSQPPTASTTASPFSPPSDVPNGTTVKIDGSTSMVLINEGLKAAFQGQFAGATVETNARGSDQGIQDLLAGSVDLAAVSRSLTDQEKGQGLEAFPVAQDAIAIVVGKENPFPGTLTGVQVAQIFQGQITDWSAVGGAAGTIRVINRPVISGTSRVFQELVLKGGSFGSSPNISTLPRDATTPLLQALGNDGIGYATFTQVAKQQTVRVVTVDGAWPNVSAYPYQRSLFYVYKSPPSEGVKAFLGYATSPQGKQAIATATSTEN